MLIDWNINLHIYSRNDIYNKLNKPILLGGNLNPIHIVTDGNHYQLITKYKDNTLFTYKLKKDSNIKGISIQYPLYYEGPKGILTKLEDLSTKRKLEVIFNESRYLDTSLEFIKLKPVKKLHVLHSFGIDIPIEIYKDDGTYSDKLDEYIKGIIGK